MTPIILHYHREMRDIVAEQRVLSGCAGDRAPWDRYTDWLFGALFLSIFFSAMSNMHFWGLPWWGYFLVVFGVQTLLTFGIKPLWRAAVTRQLREETWDVVIDENGFHLNRPITPAETGNDAPWSWFRRIIEDEDIFLIRVSWKHHFVLPKAAFPTPEALEQFRALAKVTMRGKWGPLT
jgi:hypothetical protein